MFYARKKATMVELEKALALVESRSKLHPVTVEHARKAGALRSRLRKESRDAGLVEALLFAAWQGTRAVLVSADPAFAGRDRWSRRSAFGAQATLAPHIQEWLARPCAKTRRSGAYLKSGQPKTAKV